MGRSKNLPRGAGKQDGKRELIIGRATRGYVALYHYVAVIDTVFVLAVRAQRASGFKCENQSMRKSYELTNAIRIVATLLRNPGRSQ